MGGMGGLIGSLDIIPIKNVMGLAKSEALTRSVSNIVKGIARSALEEGVEEVFKTQP